MKSSKLSGIITAVIAVIFALLATVFIIIEDEDSPVKLSGKPYIDKVGTSVEVSFTLSNAGDEDAEITYVYVEIYTTSGRTERASSSESFTLKAGQSQDLIYEYNSSYYPNAVNEITIKVNGKQFNVYGGSSSYTTAAIVLAIMTVTFAVLSAICFVGAVRQQRRYTMIEKELAARFSGNAVFVLGAYGKKGEGGKAAARTAMSVAGGALFAGLFGFGAFRVYGSNASREFVVSDEGLFIGNPMKSGFNLGNMNYMAKGAVPHSEIEVKKKRVILNNLSSGEFFIFDLRRNKNITAEALAEKLKMLTMPIAENFPETESADGDPFDL